MFSNPPTTLAGHPEIVPADCFTPLNFDEIFGRRAPVEIDLGSGEGTYLTALAGANPGTDFLGVERLAGRVGASCRRIERGGLTNARVLRFEISYVVERLIPENSVTQFHLMFPDPWPKRRHASRRLVNHIFLEALHRGLISDGTLRVATDHAGYFRQIADLISASSLFLIVSDPHPSVAVSKFEERFVGEGIVIHRLTARKVSPVIQGVASQASR